MFQRDFFLFNLDETLGVWAAFLVIWILHLIKNEEIETEQKQNVLWMCDKFTQRFLLSIRNLFEEFYSNISVLILFHSDTSRETLFVLFWCSWQASRIFWLARTCVSIIHTFIIFLQKNFSIFVCFTLFLKTECLPLSLFSSKNRKSKVCVCSCNFFYVLWIRINSLSPFPICFRAHKWKLNMESL